MNRGDRLGPPGCYELRLVGHLDEHWAARFPGFTLRDHDDGTTTLTGRVTDQAELHGHLARVRDLAAPLISVTALDDPHAARTPTADPTPKETP